MRTRVMVSGLVSPAEARAAVGAGADALGFPPEARGLGGAWPAVAAAPPGVSPVLHTRRDDPDAIAAEAREAGAAAVQLPAGLDPSAALALRREARGLRLIQTVRLDEGEEAGVELARAYSRLVDALLLEVPAPVVTFADLDSGAEARKRDWRLARQAAQASAVPVWLAGGLGQGSVGEAIDQVNPFGVDVDAGVRTGGRLDARKLSAFFHAVRVAKIG